MNRILKSPFMARNRRLNLLSNSNFEVGAPPTGWTTYGTGGSFARSNEQVKIGTYSFKITRATNNAGAYQAISDYSRYKGRKVTIGGWVYATVANRAAVQVYDGVNYNTSSLHSGVAGWKWFTKVVDIDAAATLLRAIMLVNNGDTSAYFDGLMLVEGSDCPSFHD